MPTPEHSMENTSESQRLSRTVRRDGGRPQQHLSEDMQNMNPPRLEGAPVLLAATAVPANIRSCIKDLKKTSSRKSQLEANKRKFADYAFANELLDNDALKDYEPQDDRQRRLMAVSTGRHQKENHINRRVEGMNLDIQIAYREIENFMSSILGPLSSSSADEYLEPISDLEDDLDEYLLAYYEAGKAGERPPNALELARSRK